MITSTGPLGTLILKDKNNNIIYSYNLKEGENLLIKKSTTSQSFVDINRQYDLINTEEVYESFEQLFLKIAEMQAENGFLTYQYNNIENIVCEINEDHEISYELNTKSIKNSKESIILEKIRIALNANKSVEENLTEKKLNENLESDLNSNV